MARPNITYQPRTVTYHSYNNAGGVMGKGVALAFKTTFPAIMPSYLADCRSGTLTAGDCLLVPLPVIRGRHQPAGSSPQLWAALATKAHWRDPSRIAWIASGLTSLATLAADAGAQSIAIPLSAAATAALTGTPSSHSSSTSSRGSTSGSTHRLPEGRPDPRCL